MSRRPESGVREEAASETRDGAEGLWSAAREIHLLAIPLIAVLSLLFVVGVFWFRAHGAAWVASLDGGIGEVVAKRAKGYADSGRKVEAIAEYRKAVGVPFDDPRQYVWAAQRLARLLMAQGRFEEAVTVMGEALARDEEDGWNYSLLVQALRGAGDSGEALDVAQRWFESARDRDKLSGMRWSKYTIGAIARDMGRLEEALAAFLESHSISPAGNSAYQAALLLTRLGRSDEALPLLEYVVSEEKGSLAGEARRLRARIADGAGRSR